MQLYDLFPAQDFASGVSVRNAVVQVISRISGERRVNWAGDRDDEGYKEVQAFSRPRIKNVLKLRNKDV